MAAWLCWLPVIEDAPDPNEDQPEIDEIELEVDDFVDEAEVDKAEPEAETEPETEVEPDVELNPPDRRRRPQAAKQGDLLDLPDGDDPVGATEEIRKIRRILEDLDR